MGWEGARRYGDGWKCLPNDSRAASSSRWEMYCGRMLNSPWRQHFTGVLAHTLLLLI